MVTKPWVLSNPSKQRSIFKTSTQLPSKVHHSSTPDQARPSQESLEPCLLTRNKRERLAAYTCTSTEMHQG